MVRIVGETCIVTDRTGKYCEWYCPHLNNTEIYCELYEKHLENYVRCPKCVINDINYKRKNQ